MNQNLATDLNALIEHGSHYADHREDLRQELAMIAAIEKALATIKRAKRDSAVAYGYAHFTITTVAEHVVKAHERQTFHWND